MPTPHLVLSGFMASGKTTVGRALSERTSAPFVDTDAAVVAAAAASGARVADAAPLLTTLGEPTFRRLEAEALARALEAPIPTVIAVGGGALLDPESRALALKKARVVTLTAPVDTLLARLESERAPRRPLLETPEIEASGSGALRARIETLLAERAAVYAEAHAMIASDDTRSIDDVVSAVERAWRAPALVVSLGARSYPVRFVGQTSAGAQTSAGILVRDLLEALRPSSWFHVTDATVAPLWRAPFLRAGGIPPIARVTLLPGEREKRLASVEHILHALVEAGADRSSVIVAHGGGVVSDTAGFAAAILLRGIRWISVPTTLLSMADAAIGGKTGVDLGAAKNAAGAFHQPSGVVIDVRHCATETPRAFTSGLAEIAKCGAIADPELITLLETAAMSVTDRGALAERGPLADHGPFAERGPLADHGPFADRDPLPHRLAGDVAFLEAAVLRAAAVKARIVALDERETGPRALLNFGHTLGHALEAAGGFERWTHGEAVSLGMVGALRAGSALGLTRRADADRLIALLAALGLPVDLQAPEIEAALPFLSLDKKRRGSSVRAVFLTEIGHAVLEELPLADLAALYADGT